MSTTFLAAGTDAFHPSSQADRTGFTVSGGLSAG